MIPNLMLINLFSAKMAQQYTVNFVNNIENFVSFAIYQTHPTQIPGLEVLAWKKADVFPDGQETLTWNETYNAFLTNYVDDTSVGRIFSSSQKLPASYKDEFIVADNVRKEIKSLFFLLKIIKTEIHL